jgi:hypothetical protein
VGPFLELRRSRLPRKNSFVPDAVVLRGTSAPLKGKAAAGKDFVRENCPLACAQFITASLRRA